ncbi:MAG: hypothetical protein LUD18_09560 [Lachnospiraceae bacterium]|nr:hypothetical protein [Lachnospiraceae bacterium]
MIIAREYYDQQHSNGTLQHSVFAEKHKMLMLNELFNAFWMARISHNDDQNSSKESSKRNVMGGRQNLA